MRALRLLRFLLFACLVAGVVLFSALNQQKDTTTTGTTNVANLVNLNPGFNLVK